MKSVQLFYRRQRLAWMLLVSLQFIGLSHATGGSGDGPHRLWQIGRADNSPAEFALAPTNYTGFMQWFGSPDHAYYVGLSRPQADWPYVLPGQHRMPGLAASYNARTHNAWNQMNTLPIGFVLKQVPTNGQCVFTINFCDASPKNPPQLRVTVNGTAYERDLLPGGSARSVDGDLTGAKPQTVRVGFPASLLKPGYNEITLRSTSRQLVPV